MAEGNILSGDGLGGLVAGQTALCSVGMAGAGLTYRGYDVRELAAEARIEEVAYLLRYGELPSHAELSAYIDKLKSLRD
ncbi:citrate/2-methylcitrate synthase, partial [Pseudomonas syringae group genomosp. 7]|uniref:citrate/2-methylcitrate synthase n=1 Tax=Pseudomonas syringae group genomosp. 7 TaxID=251699 RepID=UPI00376F9C26